MTTKSPTSPAPTRSPAPNGNHPSQGAGGRMPKPAPTPRSAPNTVQMDTGIDDLIDPTTLEAGAPTFPLGQWFNGDSKLTKVGGVAYTGGFVIPFTTKRGKRIVENIPADFDLPGFERTTVGFENGMEQTCLAALAADIAIIRFRRCVTKLANGKRLYLPWASYWKAYDADPTAFKGWRGKYQVLAVFRTAPTTPFAVTFTGTNSQALDTGLAAIDELVAVTGKALGATKPLPRFAVWATVRVGEHVIPNAEYTSKTTPPVVVTPEATAHTFVGRENLQAFTRLWHAATPWVEAYANPTDVEGANGNGNGNGHSEPSETEPEF